VCHLYCACPDVMDCRTVRLRSVHLRSIPSTSICLTVFRRKFWLWEQITWTLWLREAFAMFLFFSSKPCQFTGDTGAPWHHHVSVSSKLEKSFQGETWFSCSSKEVWVHKICSFFRDFLLFLWFLGIGISY